MNAAWSGRTEQGANLHIGDDASMPCFHLEPRFLLNQGHEDQLSGLRRRRAGTIVLGQFLHHELLRATGVLCLFARDADMISRLDAGHFSY